MELRLTSIRSVMMKVRLTDVICKGVVPFAPISWGKGATAFRQQSKEGPVTRPVFLSLKENMSKGGKL